MLRKYYVIGLMFFTIICMLSFTQAEEPEIYKAKNINQYIDHTEDCESPDILSIDKDTGKINNSIEFEEEFNMEFNKNTAIDDIENLDYNIIDETKDSYEVIPEYSLNRLMILSDKVENTYGAISGVSYKTFTILKYNNDSDTKNAYLNLVKDFGEDNVVIDSLYTCNAKGWGTTYMNLDNKVSNLSYPCATTVAVIDSGANTSHEIFNNVTISNKSKSFTSNSLSDKFNHGTSTAGIISENSTNKTSLLILKVINDDESISFATSLQAIQYAIENKADVINCSFGGLNTLAAQNAYDEVLRNAGNSILVAASGNENVNMIQGDKKYYPAASPYAIGVGSINNKGERSSFSNYGLDLDFVAPGQSLNLASSTGGYINASGTSYSAPYVSACVNLLKANNKTLKLSHVMTELQKISKDLGFTGLDDYYGYGVPIFNKIAEKQNITPIVTLKQPVFDYTGQNINPIQSVTYNGKSIGYSASYPNGNKDVGKKTINVKVVDSKYTGSTSISFKIRPSTPYVPYRTFRNGIMHIKYSSKGADGYEIYVSTNGLNYKRYDTKYLEYLVRIPDTKASKVFIKIRSYKIVNNIRYVSEFKNTAALKNIDFK